MWLPSFTRNKEFAHRLKMLTLFSLLSCFLNFQVLEVGYQSLNMNKETAVNQTGQCMFCRTWNQHNCTKLWYVMSLKMFGCFVHSRCGNKLLTPCEVIGVLKSGKFLLVAVWNTIFWAFESVIYINSRNLESCFRRNLECST